MNVPDAVRGVLARLDVETFRDAWPRILPGQSPPRTRGEALTLMHAARALCAAIPMRLRRHSTEWLSGRGIAVPIPLDLLPEPPRVAGVTALSINASHPEVERAIYGAMNGALLDSEALGDKPAVTRAQMQAARHRERRALGLRPLV